MSTRKTIVRKAHERSVRSLFDISSKVKAAGIAAASTDATAVGAYLAGQIGVHALLGIAVATTVPVIAAYAKTNVEEVREAVEETAKVAREVGDVVEAIAPEARPVVDVVEDSVATVAAMLEQPQPEPALVPSVPATTDTLSLAPSPAAVL